MKFKPILSVLFVAALVVSLLVNGCQQARNELPTLRIGYTQWPGYDVVLYGMEKDLFKKRGLNLELVAFDVQADQTRALMQGHLDAVFTTVGELVLADSSIKEKQVFMLLLGLSHGSDGIVAQKQYKSIEDLRGKTIGAKLGSANHLFLLEVLQEKGMKPNEVELLDSSSEISQQKMIEGNLDAVSLWEPFLSRTAEAIDGNTLVTTKDFNDTVIDGLVSPSSFVATHTQEFKKFILGWLDIMHAIETNPDEVFQVVGEKLDQTKEEFAADYAGVLKGDMEQNKKILQKESFLNSIQKLTQLLREDERHGRNVQEDVFEVNKEIITSAIKEWKPLN